MRDLPILLALHLSPSHNSYHHHLHLKDALANTLANLLPLTPGLHTGASYIFLYNRILLKCFSYEADIPPKVCACVDEGILSWIDGISEDIILHVSFI